MTCEKSLTAMPTEDQISSFIDAYITTALWSSTDESLVAPLEDNYEPEDLAVSTRLSMEDDCRQFIACNISDLQDAITTGSILLFEPDNFDFWGRAGHDFWLTRNGHGAGFWDGDWPEPQATHLTIACEAWPTIELYVDDEGKVRQ